MNEKYHDTREFLSVYSGFKSSTRRLYSDLKALIKERLQPKTGEEKCCNIFSFDETDWVLQYHVIVNERVLGLSLIIFVDERSARTDHYKSIMDSIGVEPSIPLVLLYGIFDPIDLDGYRPTDWWQLCLGYDNWSGAEIPKPVCFDKEINIRTHIPSESYHWFSSGKYKIVSMLDIENQADLQDVVDDIVRMANPAK